MTGDTLLRRLRFEPLIFVVPAVVVAAIAGPLLVRGDMQEVPKLLAATAPSLLILCWFIRSDRSPEPPGIMLATFVLGALSCDLSGIPSVLVGGPMGFPVLDAFVLAAIPEETAKMLVLLLYCSRRRVFNEPMDGLVYGVTVSLGFATLENVMYVFYFPSPSGWLTLAIVRAVTALPAHAVFGAVMGFLVGLSQALPARRRRLLCTGWIVAVALHGAYDCLAFTAMSPLTIFCTVFLWNLARGLRRKLREVQLGKNPETALNEVWDVVAYV